MRRNPLLWIGVGGLIVTAIMGSVPGMVIFGCAAVGGLLMGALRSRAPSDAIPSEKLGQEARWQTRKIRELRDELHKISAAPGDSVEGGVIAAEAAAEADRIFDKSLSLVAVRERLKALQKGRGEAETELGRLERQLAEARSDGERTALESARASRMLQIEAMDDAKQKVEEIDGQIRSAEANLSELKARLGVGIASGEGLVGHQDEFNELIGRLRTLGTSFDEAREMVEAKTE